MGRRWTKMEATSVNHTSHKTGRCQFTRAARHEVTTKTGHFQKIKLRDSNKKLMFQARETGICPIRRELYSQCFDELIRQITINCGERGLLLLRIRDEMNMTMEVYQALYCSSIAFGMRKALQAEQAKSDLQGNVDRLQEEKVEVEHQLIDLRQKAEQNERRAEEIRIAEEKKHNEEISFLKKTNIQLKVISLVLLLRCRKDSNILKCSVLVSFLKVKITYAQLI